MPERPVTSSAETTKQRAERIDRDYYKAPDGFVRWKRRLARAALAIGIMWCAWGAFDKDRHYSPGPVASAHAMWENNCDACHLQFMPIRGDTWMSSAETQHRLDGMCVACHAAPPHHSLEKPADLAGCTSCHTDHHGRDASLVRMDDRQCTRCHADLNVHRITPKDSSASLPDNLAKISRFDREHPEFQLPKSDPGKLKFSHRRHMAPGLNLGQSDRFPALKWTDIPTSQRTNYQPQNVGDDALIQLNCATCHQFTSSRDLDTGGAHSLPIVYENHCAVCHPLDYNPDSAPAEGVSGRLSEKRETIPHGLSAEQIREFLEATYAEALLRQDQKLLESRVRAAPLPAPLDREIKTVADQVHEKVGRTATFLRGRCGECHVLEDRALAASDGDKQQTELWFNVAPTNVPQVWFKKARFDHAAHRALGCRDCHTQAFSSELPTGGQPMPSTDNELVMLPQRETCLRCHAPQSSRGGGARFDCVECHAYHHQDRSLNGRASPTRDAPGERTLEQFINASGGK